MLGQTSLEKYIQISSKIFKSGFVLRLGLDDFREINERYGVEYGDKVLKDTAECISGCLKGEQQLYRVVSDEFIIVDYLATGIDEAKSVYHSIRHAIDRYVESIQYDNAFRMCFSDPNQGSASADYIAENKLATKVAIIYNSSDTYSSGIYQTFATEAKAKGLDVVAAEAFTADNKTDFSVQIQKAKDAGAELVFLPIYYQEASLILAQANKAGFTPKWFGCDGMDGILDLDGFDASLAEDLMFLTPFTANATDEATQKFVADYKEAFGDTPIQFAADAYDCVYVIKAAAEKEGVTPDKSVSDICDALKKGMTEITYDGLTGKSITWSEDGEPTKEPTVVVVKSGEYQVLQAEDAAE